MQQVLYNLAERFTFEPYKTGLKEALGSFVPVDAQLDLVVLLGGHLHLVAKE